jgi:GntR family transcriptional regulator/MocR family aminotransferase
MPPLPLPIARSAVIAQLHLDRASASSLKEQIYRGLRELIVAGHIARGTLLPSTRVFATELGVSRNTIVAAFEQLIGEGYVTTKLGAGSFVNERLPEDLLAAPPAPALLVKRAPINGPPRIASHAFALGIPALDEFPYDVWRRLVAKRWRRPGSLSGYGATAGLRALRDAIVDHVASSRGVRCSADQVFVVSGAHQAFDLAARVTLERDSAVWVEDPGYLGAGRAFQAAGGSLIPVPVDADGIIVDHGLRVAPTPRLIFVTPSQQFPLGATLSMARRTALLAAANTADAWIVEDDYDCEFRYEGRPLPSLQGLDGEGRVIYVGSFSKGLLPGLRLAYLIAPPSLIDPIAELRAVSGSHPPLGDQAVVADFMRDGHYARHIRRMRALYSHRRGCLVDAVRAELGASVDLDVPAGGTHAIAFVNRVDDVALSAAAAERGVIALPLSAQYRGAGARQGLMLGYGGVREPIMTRAVRALAASLAAVTTSETVRRSAS